MQLNKTHFSFHSAVHYKRSLLDVSLANPLDVSIACSQLEELPWVLALDPIQNMGNQNAASVVTEYSRPLSSYEPVDIK